LDVKAFDSAPMASKDSAMKRAEYRSEPLNSRCSRKWEAPASEGISSLVPVSAQQPTAIERTDGMVSVITRRPLGSVLSS
jgi:hypothetical protein